MTRERAPHTQDTSEGRGPGLPHGSFGTRGTQPHAALASRAPSAPRRTHAQARVQHRGQRRGPWRPASGQRAPVPAGLWPHRRVEPASLTAQRTGNRPLADDREDSSGGVSGGCPCPSRPCASRLPLEVSVLVSHFARHCPSCGASGAPGLIQPWMTTSPPCPPGSCQMQSSKLRHFQSALTRGFWDFYGFRPTPPRGTPKVPLSRGESSEDPSQVD